MGRGDIIQKYGKQVSEVPATSGDVSREPGPGTSAVKPNLKRIGTMAGALGVVLAGVFAFSYYSQSASVYAGVIGCLVLGSALGAIIGLVVYVNPFRQFVAPIIFLAVLAIAIWCVAFMSSDEWKLTRDNYLALVGLLFVFAVIGYGIGYWSYQKMLQRKRLFETRMRGNHDTPTGV